MRHAPRPREPRHRDRAADRPPRRRRARARRPARPTPSPTSPAAPAAPRASRPAWSTASGAACTSATTSCSSTSAAPAARAAAAERNGGRRHHDQSLSRVAERRPDAVRHRAAADDLEAVRAALGYRTLNVYGISYGRRSRRSTTWPGTARRAVRRSRRGDADRHPLLRQVRRQRAARARPRRPALPRASRLRARSRLAAAAPLLIEAWNARPVAVGPDVTLSGTASRPDPVDDAERVVGGFDPARRRPGGARRLRPLARQIPMADSPPMFWSIWCNERWVGLDARGPGAPTSTATPPRSSSATAPWHAADHQAASNLARVRSSVPVLALVGGADPQDPPPTSPGSVRRCRGRASSSCPSTGTASASTAACRTSSRSSSTAAVPPRSTCAVRATEPPPFALR